jgi:hypothetical protein
MSTARRRSAEAVVAAAVTVLVAGPVWLATGLYVGMDDGVGTGTDVVAALVGAAALGAAPLWWVARHGTRRSRAAVAAVVAAVALLGVVQAVGRTTT